MKNNKLMVITSTLINNKKAKLKKQVPNLASLEADMEKTLVNVFKIKKLENSTHFILHDKIATWLKTSNGLFVKSYLRKLYFHRIKEIYCSQYTSHSHSHTVNSGLIGSISYIIRTKRYNIHSVVIPGLEKDLSSLTTTDLSTIIKKDKISLWDKISEDGYEK